MNNNFRVGIGQDSHRFSKVRKPLVLGGVEISKSGGLEGKSDADAILHSLCNAISSATGGDSLSTWSDEMCQRGIKDSREYLKFIVREVSGKNYQIVNVSVAVEAKKPRVELVSIKKMKETISGILSITSDSVGITFTSGEGLTVFGKGLGIQSISQVLLCQK